MTLQTRISRGINAQGQIVETVVEYDPDVIAARKAAIELRNLPAYVSGKANAKRNGGITVSGLPVGTDTEGKALLIGANLYLAANPTATVQFVVSSTQAVSLDKPAIDGMFAAVTAFVQACFAAEAQINTAIIAGSITTQAQVDTALAALPSTF